MTSEPSDQLRRAVAFHHLHEAPHPFVVANAWDAGTSRLFTRLGFAALATTSGGLALSLGRPDGANLVSRREALDNLGAITAATDLPVTADLESGFADDEDGVFETIRLAAGAGAVGGSIEDTSGDPAAPVRPLAEAAGRVRAAVAAARSLPFPFTLTARADNFLHGRPDLDDTIRRLRAFEEAGADVLYAPGLPDLAAVRAICAAVSRPVNALAGSLPEMTVSRLGECGVRRVSVGSALARAALSAAWQAAGEVRDHGTFGFGAGAVSLAEVSRFWTGGAAPSGPAGGRR